MQSRVTLHGRCSFLCCGASDKGFGEVSSHDATQKEVMWCTSRVLTKAENITPTLNEKLYFSFLELRDFQVI